MSNWSEQYGPEQMPNKQQLSDYIDNPLWEQFSRWLTATYACEPLLQYSKCSMERGWNIKYRKGSKAICTIYPRAGSVTCMVSVGSKQLAETEEYLESCAPVLQELYRNTALFNGGKWLLIDLTSAEILDNLKGLLQIRMGGK